MDGVDIRNILDQIRGDRKIRGTIYLNEERVNEHYGRYFNQIDEVTIKNEWNSEIEGGFNFLAAIKAKLGIRRGEDARISIPPVMKALLLEYYMKAKSRLKDPCIDVYNYDDFFRHISSSSLIKHFEEVNMDKTNYPDNFVQIAQNLRIEQQNSKPRGDNRAFVWTSKCRRDNSSSYLASIAFLDYLYSEGEYASANPPIGIFGLREKDDDIFFIKPISIWNETPLDFTAM